MTAQDALTPIASLAGDSIVITTMASVRDWPGDAASPLLFHYMPSSMGQGPALGLGLALAQPARRTVVLNGDGCMLMNLGVLVTIAQQQPRNYILVVLDNGIYEVTGGQPHAGSGTVDHCGLARSAGIRQAFDFSDGGSWRNRAAEVLSLPGPIFVRLGIEPRYGCSTPKPPRKMAEQIQRLRGALGVRPPQETQWAREPGASAPGCEE